MFGKRRNRRERHRQRRLVDEQQILGELVRQPAHFAAGERRSAGNPRLPVEPRHQVDRSRLMIERQQRHGVAGGHRIRTLFGRAVHPLDEHLIGRVALRGEGDVAGVAALRVRRRCALRRDIPAAPAIGMRGRVVDIVGVGSGQQVAVRADHVASCDHARYVQGAGRHVT